MKNRRKGLVFIFCPGNTNLFLHLFLLHFDADGRPLGDVSGVPLGVERQGLGQGVLKIGRGKMPHKLRPVKGLCRMDLPREGGIQRAGPQEPDVGLGVDVQRIIPDVGEQPSPEIKEGTVVEIFAPTQYGNVIQVPVFIAKHHIYLKEQSQILAKS